MQWDAVVTRSDVLTELENARVRTHGASLNVQERAGRFRIIHTVLTVKGRQQQVLSGWILAKTAYKRLAAL